ATPHGPSLTLSACGSYAARLATVEAGWYAERWTLDGPEPYAVPLPVGQPEDPGTEVLPLSDGRVLIARRSAGSYLLSLLYPTGPDTGELTLGSVGCPWMTLLPPAPDGVRAYGLVVEGDATTVWLVCGGGQGPQPVLTVPGRCQDGAWLDRDGRLLALNRTDSGGRTRAVTVDVAAGGEAAVLLHIGERSNDRLLLADPDSGLLLVASDAPGKERIGWGVLGSHRPVRFPEALYPDGVAVHPLAVQPAQVLTPESCGVALRLMGTEGDWPAVWRPQQRDLQHFPAPAGWLPDGSHWTPGGELLLPFVEHAAPCGVLRLPASAVEPAGAWEDGTPTGSGSAAVSVPGGPTDTGSFEAFPAETGAAALVAPGPEQFGEQLTEPFKPFREWAPQDVSDASVREAGGQQPGEQDVAHAPDVAPWAASADAAGLPTPTPWAGTPTLPDPVDTTAAADTPGSGWPAPGADGSPAGGNGGGYTADSAESPWQVTERGDEPGSGAGFSMLDHAWAGDAGRPEPPGPPGTDGRSEDTRPAGTDGPSATDAPWPSPPGGNAAAPPHGAPDELSPGQPASWPGGGAPDPTSGHAPPGPRDGTVAGAAWQDDWTTPPADLFGPTAGGPTAAQPEPWHAGAAEPHPWGWAPLPADPVDPARADRAEGLRLPGDGGRYAAGFPPSEGPAAHRGFASETPPTAAYQPAGSTMTDNHTDARTDTAPNAPGATDAPPVPPQQDAGAEEDRTQGVCKPITLQQALGRS
ncbi:hypothetical protein, partial [Streptomyces lonarensis]